MLKSISDIDCLVPEQRLPLTSSEPEESQFAGREEWLIISQHHQELTRIGVNLLASEIESAIEGYPCNVEGAVLAFLERFKQPSISATRKLVVLIRQGATPSNPSYANVPQLPVCTAQDFVEPLVPPTPAPRRSIPELQASLDAGGVRARATTAAIKHNPQWGLEVVGGRIRARLTEEICNQLEEVPF